MHRKNNHMVLTNIKRNNRDTSRKNNPDEEDLDVEKTNYFRGPKMTRAHWPDASAR
jgi:hypothetical protein